MTKKNWQKVKEEFEKEEALSAEEESLEKPESPLLEEVASREQLEQG